MSLTDLAIRNAKPGERPVKLFDERGLYLQLNPNGSRWWRVKYQFAGKAQLLSAGVYPEVSLKEARQRRDEIRRQVRDGIDPSASRKAARQAETGADSFAALAREWQGRFQNDWSPSYREKVASHINELLPWLGPRLIKAIEPPELLAVARRIESRARWKPLIEPYKPQGASFGTGWPPAESRAILPPISAGLYHRCGVNTSPRSPIQ